MEKFEDIYNRALDRKGSETALHRMLSPPLDNKELIKLSDDYILSEFCKKIFQSGFVWRVVEQKWAGFQEVFWGFSVDKLILMPDDLLEKKASDPAIIRNFTKVKSIRDNAIFFREIQDKFGSFSKWIAEWDSSEIVELWLDLKLKGSRLGGNTGPYSLRAIGKDTFLLSRDVEAYFRSYKLIDGGLTTKRNLKIIQESFNTWKSESQYSYKELSQIVAFSCGENYLYDG